MLMLVTKIIALCWLTCMLHLCKSEPLLYSCIRGCVYVSPSKISRIFILDAATEYQKYDYFWLTYLTYESLIYPAYVVSYKFLSSYACQKFLTCVCHQMKYLPMMYSMNITKKVTCIVPVYVDMLQTFCCH